MFGNSIRNFSKNTRKVETESGKLCRKREPSVNTISLNVEYNEDTNQKKYNSKRILSLNLAIIKK